MVKWLSILAIVFGGLVLGPGLNLFERHLRNNTLRTRPDMTDEELLICIPKDTPSLMALRAWKQAGEIFGVDCRKLRADDHLSDLSALPKWLGSNGMTAIDKVSDIAEDYYATNRQLSPAAPETVGDVVELLVYRHMNESESHKT